MKNKFIVLILIWVMTLTSCTSNFKVNENVVKEVSDKITEVIIDTVGNEETQCQESYTIKANTLKTLNIKNSVGDIYITSHESEDAVINVNISASSSSKEASQNLIENFQYTVKKQFDSIIIDTTSQHLENDDNKNIKTNLEIYLPSNIENIVISSNVGNVNTEGINGEFKAYCHIGNINIENSQGIYTLKTDVGNIDVEKSSASGNSEFISNTGDIKVYFTDTTYADTLILTTGVGDIEMKIPENSDYSAVINESMEKQIIEANGRENTQIELKTNVGSIIFN